MSFFKTIGMAALGMSIMTSTALAEECKPSKWGADDELGSANLVTPERTLAATKLIKKGKSKPLGVVIDSNTPAYPPRGLNLQVVQPTSRAARVYSHTREVTMMT